MNVLLCILILTPDSHPEVPSFQPSNWTGLIDLDKEPIIDAKSSSDNYITVSLFENDASLDWSNQADSLQDTWNEVSPKVPEVTTESPGGMAKEETEDVEELVIRMVTEAPTTLPATTETAGSFGSIMSSFWNPWTYLMGNKEEVKDATQSPIVELAKTTVQDVKTTAPVEKSEVRVVATNVPSDMKPETSAPVLEGEDSSPVGKTTIPGAETSSTGKTANRSGVETTSSVQKSTTEVVEPTTPTERTTVLDAETTVPVEKANLSMVEITTSSEEVNRLMVETTASGGRITVPAVETSSSDDEGTNAPTTSMGKTTIPVKETTSLTMKTPGRIRLSSLYDRLSYILGDRGNRGLVIRKGRHFFGDAFEQGGS